MLKFLLEQLLALVFALVVSTAARYLLDTSFLFVFSMTIIPLEITYLYALFVVIPWGDASYRAAKLGLNKSAIYLNADKAVLFPPPMFLRDFILKNQLHWPDPDSGNTGLF